MCRLLIDTNLAVESKDILISNGYSLIETANIPTILNSTSTHPDMQFLLLAKNEALVCKELFDYYINLLPDFKLVPFDGIGSKYPYDCTLNIVRMKKSAILTKYQYSRLKNYIIETPIYVNQGYTKCSICILNDRAIITGDKGIAQSLENSGIKVYFLNDKQIILNGYQNGFWGGCTGLLKSNTLFFNGNIEKLDCYIQLIKILENENIEPLYQRKKPLTDNGSILLLDI